MTDISIYMMLPAAEIELGRKHLIVSVS